jgi:hypothetical protein
MKPELLRSGRVRGRNMASAIISFDRIEPEDRVAVAVLRLLDPGTVKLDHVSNLHGCGIAFDCVDL